jgi:N-acyl-D-aspartate/D-glutamate deacylase
MFPLDATPGRARLRARRDAELLVRARQRGCSALEALYDHFAPATAASCLLPDLQLQRGNLDVVRQMLEHPRALLGLSDAGAHVGTSVTPAPAPSC